MKYLLYFIVFMLMPFLSDCQTFSISLLQKISQSRAITPLVNGGTGSDGTDFSIHLSYEHLLGKNRYSLIASYSGFEGCTLMYFEPGGWINSSGSSVTAFGFCDGVKVHRYDLGLAMNLINPGRKFYLKPGLFVGLQHSNVTDISFWNTGDPINGPNYFQLEPMIAIPMNTIQFVPSIGVDMGFVLWKRLKLGIGIHGAYASKPYQKLYLKYKYKGVEQPMAEYESTGTGLFVTLGIGYRFVKLKD